MDAAPGRFDTALQQDDKRPQSPSAQRLNDLLEIPRCARALECDGSRVGERGELFGDRGRGQCGPPFAPEILDRDVAGAGYRGKPTANLGFPSADLADKDQHEFVVGHAYCLGVVGSGPRRPLADHPSKRGDEEPVGEPASEAEHDECHYEGGRIVKERESQESG